MEETFENDLDTLITKYKERGVGLDKLVTEMKSAIEGLEAELGERID